MRLVNQFEQDLTASHGPRDAAEELGVAVEVAVGIGDPHIGYRRPEAVKRAAGDKTDEADAVIGTPNPPFPTSSVKGLGATSIGQLVSFRLTQPETPDQRHRIGKNGDTAS